ncbi:phosphopantetheine-binding protein [Fibrella aquatilis]|uniref:4-coumarate--CoA ligase n=1 Tax=Fibrella aquatilis TaxID=2817059 RepID=A0A939JVG6_9BACT|nr:phosphopantetheine-binding protein [Fibrella aquatilis]MBO0930832.1 4-coumarate--CoA ligase [Fibrella aquatilis]
MNWTPDTVRRLVLDMLAGLLGLPPGGITAGADLYRDMGVDSITRLELAARLNEFFGLFNSAANHYLLADTLLDNWVQKIIHARQESDEFITFRTSGTGGSSRAVRHRLTDLLAEARFWSDYLPQPNQVVSLVGGQHIYGFMFTVLLPHVWARPVLPFAQSGTTALVAGVLVVGTPFMWEYLLRSVGAGQLRQCSGVTSTAPMAPDLAQQLIGAGVELTEVYGSSETAGIAYRHHPDQPFTLLPYHTLLPDSDPMVIRRTDTNECYTLPDRVDQPAPRQLRVLGRRDEAVAIAGVNVYPDHIRQVVLACPLVADCDIHAKGDGGTVQLYGAVRLRHNSAANQEACRQWLHDHLTAPEIPRHLYLY